MKLAFSKGKLSTNFKNLNKREILPLVYNSNGCNMRDDLWDISVGFYGVIYFVLYCIVHQLSLLFCCKFIIVALIDKKLALLLQGSLQILLLLLLLHKLSYTYHTLSTLYLVRNSWNLLYTCLLSDILNIYTNLLLKQIKLICTF